MPVIDLYSYHVRKFTYGETMTSIKTRKNLVSLPQAVKSLVTVVVVLYACRLSPHG